MKVLDFIKTEIPFVNYVWDSKEAQVHVLITTQETAGGGVEYTITFMGKQDYSGMGDTLKYISKQFDTEDDIRRGMVQSLKMGLMRYVAKTPVADQISISFAPEVAPTAVVDKWNNWVFSISLNGFFNGEKIRNFNRIYGTFSAKRITLDLKVNLSVNTSYYESNFKTEDRTITSILRSKSFYGLVVKSLNDHWPLGISASANSSTFNNIKFSFGTAPTIEYDLFPYSQSTRRQLRFLYSAGQEFSRYMEETIFDKTSENLFYEALSVTLELKQTWGSVTTNVEGSHYFHDVSKNRLQLYSELSLRLFKGLSFNLTSYVSLIHNQLSLPKGGASREDILLQRKQLATQYQYFATIGLSYTFGSIYSNVVNPRFGD